MKYYGKFNDEHDLITVKKGGQIAQSEINSSLQEGGAIAQHVATHGGKIDEIKVAGTTQSIVNKVVNIPTVNAVDSTASGSLYPLAANQGKVLNDRIDNLESIGRYLALWDCTTGKPTTNPTTMPYTYKAGDYYRVSAVSESSEQVNYRPEGSSYNDVASTTQETEDVQIGDVYFYDGTSWSLQINHIGGLVTDVKVDGVSVVTGSTANITGKENTSNKVTALSNSSTNIEYPSAKCVYDYANTKATIIKSISQPASIKTGDWWYDIVGVYNITNTLTHCTGAAGNPTTIEEGGTAMLVYTADTDYVLPNTVTVTGATYTWTKATGTLVLSNATDNVSINIVAKPSDPTKSPLNFTALIAGSTVSLNNPGLSKDFSYSTDGVSWATFTPGSTVVTLENIGDIVYFKGNNPNGLSSSSGAFYTFAMTGSIAAGGNVMSLLDDGACTTLTIPNYNCFSKLFYNCTALVTPPELPATSWSGYCCGQLFAGCTSLQVNDNPVPGVAEQEWKIPTNGTCSCCEDDSWNMFSNCAGTRSTDSPNFSGTQKTYYIQSRP